MTQTVIDFSAARLAQIQPSPILAVVAKASEMRAQGVEVIDLSIGEPDFATPEHIRRAGVAAIEGGFTRYTPTTGVRGLREAIVQKFKRENDLAYTVEEIATACGGKQVIFNAMVASIEDGQEVVIPAPYWASYPDIVRLAGGKPVIVPCGQEAEFKLRPSGLGAALSRKTRWVIINSPANPTGATYSRDELEALADILRQWPKVLILSDEIYEHIVYDGNTSTSLLEVAPDLRSRMLIVNGLSKTYSMTGWRFGYAAGPAALVRAMNAVMGHTATQTSTIAQYAAMEALNGPQTHVVQRRHLFEARRDRLVFSLNSIPGFQCLKPGGAFYVYPSVAGLLGRSTSGGEVLRSDRDVALFLLREAHVATVQGEAFGLSPHLRLSYATSEEALAAACDRIADAVAKLESAAEDETGGRRRRVR